MKIKNESGGVPSDIRDTCCFYRSRAIYKIIWASAIKTRDYHKA